MENRAPTKKSSGLIELHRRRTTGLDSQEGRMSTGWNPDVEVVAGIGDKVVEADGAADEKPLKGRWLGTKIKSG